MKTKTQLIPLITLALSFAIANTVSANFFQGFETNNNYWNLNPTNFPPAVRVPTLTDGIQAHSGGYFAEVPGPYQLCDPITGEAPGSSYTNYGGYSYVFPTGGYITDLWIYLDPEGTTAANDTRFDWIASSVSTPNCDFRRDFVFNAGFYDDEGLGRRFVISVGNNSSRCDSFPKNPGHYPISISRTGWYKFEAEFADNGSGALAGTLSIYDENDNLVHEWDPLSDPSDTIGTNVGGNRYGWFPSQEFPFLAIDDSALTGFQIYCQAGSGPAGSPGYWMNHPDAWCTESITIGGHTYTKDQAIGFMRRFTSKDMTYQMFAQLVAAELNVNCLHSNQTCVIDAILAADAWMEDHPVGDNVKARSPEWREMTQDYNILANYNQGRLCAPPIQ